MRRKRYCDHNKTAEELGVCLNSFNLAVGSGALKLNVSLGPLECSKPRAIQSWRKRLSQLVRGLIGPIRIKRLCPFTPTVIRFIQTRSEHKNEATQGV